MDQDGLFYTAYADESSHSEGRFRSIGCISIPTKYDPKVIEALRCILREAKLGEFKWQKLRGKQYRECAERFLGFVVNNLELLNIRIDVLIWDVEDRRHAVNNRDDLKNYDIMFFHLLKNSMFRREPNAFWNILPDRKCGANWSKICDCLRSVGLRRQYFGNVLIGPEESERAFYISNLQPIESMSTPPCQVADLFAGAAVFSRNHVSNFAVWRRVYSPQQDLFEKSKKLKLPKAWHPRFTFIQRLDLLAKSNNLGISLEERGFLWTPNPANRINFWHYEPQHQLDKAPTKNDHLMVHADNVQ